MVSGRHAISVLAGPGTARQLTIANASGGHWTQLPDTTDIAHAWSPDGQWIAFLRDEGGKQQLVKMKPVADATPVVLANAAPGLRPTTRMFSGLPPETGSRIHRPTAFP